MNVKNKLVVTFLVFLQCLLFYLFFYNYSHKMPFIQSDELEYILQGYFVHNNFNMIHFTARPVFSIFSIIIMKLLNIPYKYNSLLSFNVAIYHLIFLFSLWYIVKNLKLSKYVFLLTVSIVFAMPLFFVYSYVIYGDIPVFSWILLSTAVLVSLYNPSFRKIKLILLGVVLALGFQTKPIFPFVALILILSFTFINVLRSLLLNQKSLGLNIKSLAFYFLFCLLGFLPVLWLVVPTKLLYLIQELYYNDEVLGYWTIYKGIFSSLWFPITIFNEITFLLALILTFFILFKTITLIKNNFKKEWKEGLIELTQHKVTFIVLSFIIMVIYVSFYVQTKDSRLFLFLIPLYIFLCVLSIHSFAKDKPGLFNKLSLGIVIFNVVCTVSWFSTDNFLIVNQVLSLKTLSFQYNKPQTKPEISNNLTYEDVGILNILKKIDDDNTKNENHSKVVVFIPHNSFTFNNTVVSAASIFSNKLYGFVPQIAHKLKTHFYLGSANYNHGSIFGDGGIPQTFFICNYIILVKNNFIGVFPGNTEIYNRIIVRELSKQNSVFMDGLVPIYKTKNRLNDEIIIYKREKSLKAVNLAKMIDQFAKEDPLNMFNVSFIDAALRISPNLTNLKNQLDKMADPKFIKSVKYRYGTPEEELLIKRILISRRVLKTKED